MPFPILGAIAAAGTLAGIYNSFTGPSRQGRHNMKLARFQAAANERYQDRQNQYNTPANQMRRFKEAGLNPHLAYNQGNPGNQASPLTHPTIQPADYQSNAATAALIPLYNQTRMTSAQVGAKEADTAKTVADTELKKIQKAVLEKNPLLDPSALDAIVSSLKSTAQIKATEALLKGQEFERGFVNTQWFTENGMKKLDAEFALLEQRFNLGSQDQKIKAQVLQSKEFQNAILEVQKKFMTDAEITPQHIMTFLQLLLMKML